MQALHCAVYVLVVTTFLLWCSSALCLRVLVLASVAIRAISTRNFVQISCLCSTIALLTGCHPASTKFCGLALTIHCMLTLSADNGQARFEQFNPAMAQMQSLTAFIIRSKPSGQGFNVTWAARYNTGLLNKLTPKGVLFSFAFLVSFLFNVCVLIHVGDCDAGGRNLASEVHYCVRRNPRRSYRAAKTS